MTGEREDSSRGKKKVVIYLEHTRSACTCDLHQPTKSQKEKKRNGCPSATAATDLVCYLFCWQKKAQNCLKAWSAIFFLNSTCHNQSVCDLGQVNSWLLKILNSEKEQKNT
jgi:hypothetical protein